MELSSRRLLLAGLLVLLVVAALGIMGYWADQSPTTGEVTIIAEDGTERGTVSVRVAATFRERYTGLSDTDALGPNEGMLFVHDTEGTYSYVMRDMAFPIDILFISTNQQITTIHHATVEEPPLTQYEGRGKWVLEVPYHWTTRHNVTVGDRVRIQRSAN
jgi:uncharacterized membrane protein (UPF0127 family)